MLITKIFVLHQWMFLIRISKTLLIHQNVYLAYFKISIGDQQKRQTIHILLKI